MYFMNRSVSHRFQNSACRRYQKCGANVCFEHGNYAQSRLTVGILVYKAESTPTQFMWEPGHYLWIA